MATKSKSKTDQILHIYTRVSTVSQADKGSSLQTQLELGKKKAKQLGFGYKHWDEGGKSSHHEEIAERPILADLLLKIREGEVKHLFVYDQSRISRIDIVATTVRYECQKQNVTLYTKDGHFDLSNPQEKFLKQVLDGIAEFENAVRADRTRLGKINRVKGGFWHGGPPPFGYKLVDKKLVLEKKEATWVKRIYQESAKGLSTLDLKKLLDSKGVLPRRRAGSWSIGSLRALIRNTHYKGVYEYFDKKSGRRYEVQCPAIVDETTWKAVQELKTRVTSRVSQQNRTKQFYLLRNLMVCGHCGTLMSGRKKASNFEQHYYCPSKERDWAKIGGTETPWKRGEGCGMSRALNIPATDKLVWESVLDIHKKSSTLKEEVKWKILKEAGAPLAQTDVDTKEIERNIVKVKKQLVAAKEAQAKMILNFHSGEIRADVYEVAIRGSRESLDDLEVKLANLELQKRGHEKDAKWVGWLKIFGKQIEAKNAYNDEERKAYLGGLLREIKVKYLESKNLHELTLQFNLPIVDDGVNWNDPNDKKKGYTLRRGKKQTKVQLLGVERRGRKALPKNTPERNDSVTVE
jgi:DNA invertase Pin-like site-specific DNA recombinase